MPGRNSAGPRPTGSRTVSVRLFLLFLTIVVVGAAANGARADLIFLKDGFVLEGKVSREGATAVDPHSMQGIWMPKGFYWVDDGARRVAFSPGQVQVVEPREYNAEYDIRSIRVIVGQRLLPPLREIVAAGPWDKRWDRSIRVLCGTPARPQQINVLQHLSLLTPHFARMETLGVDFRWAPAFLTRELGPEMVRGLLAQHPDYADDPTRPVNERAARRFKAFHFLVQAGWYEEAERDLTLIEKDLPDQKEKVQTAREGLKRLLSNQQLDAVRRAQAAGQPALAQKLLTNFPEQGGSEKALAEVRILRARAEKSAEDLKQLRRYLDELPRAMDNAPQRGLFTEAARKIAEELDPDSAGRLDPFLSQAVLAERQKQQGGKAELGPGQLLALAVTGWLLGGTSAETKVESALRLWQARELALKYQRTSDVNDRRKLLEDYQSQKADAIGVDEMAQLLGGLPPPEPEEKLGNGAIKLETKAARGRRKAITYHVQPPPEYHHGRSYPVLFVLHHGGEGVREMLERCREPAGHQGYLLVAPEWGQGLRAVYTHTAEEHAAVLDVLRDLRRRFHVDSDRVFLFGYGDGANMAYDVSLAHPDEFAGVVAMSGIPGLTAQRYKRNGQYLPFYVVSGDLAGGAHQENRQMFEDWIPRGHPAMFVERRGRGPEWFGGEVPYVFEWMKSKKRMTPLLETGAQGREFQSMRATDNRFYWLSSDDIHPRHLNEGPKWDARVLSATLFGHVNRESNTVTVRTVGLRQVTVWLGRDSTGQAMINFSVPLTVALNGQAKWNGKVTPSIETLLEDVYQRGDRQRLFLARIDFNKL